MISIKVPFIFYLGSIVIMLLMLLAHFFQFIFEQSLLFNWKLRNFFTVILSRFYRLNFNYFEKFNGIFGISFLRARIFPEKSEET